MTSKLTREELRKRAKENINNLRFASKQRAFESARKEILADLQLAEYALEAMESEPYGFTEGERFGMVLEPRQWPAPKDGEPQLHIKNRLARYPRRVFASRHRKVEVNAAHVRKIMRKRRRSVGKSNKLGCRFTAEMRVGLICDMNFWALVCRSNRQNAIKD